MVSVGEAVFVCIEAGLVGNKKHKAVADLVSRPSSVIGTLSFSNREIRKRRHGKGTVEPEEDVSCCGVEECFKHENHNRMETRPLDKSIVEGSTLKTEIETSSDPSYEVKKCAITAACSSVATVVKLDEHVVSGGVTPSKFPAKSAECDYDKVSYAPAELPACFDVKINPQALTDVMSHPSSRIIYWSDETGGFIKSDGTLENTEKRIHQAEKTKRPFPEKGIVHQSSFANAHQNRIVADVHYIHPKKRVLVRWKIQYAEE